jgi:hypothetical protein
MLTIREWFAAWGWSDQAAVSLLAGSTALAGLSLDDEPPVGAVVPSQVAPWVRRCGFCQCRVRVCDATFLLADGGRCPGSALPVNLCSTDLRMV